METKKGFTLIELIVSIAFLSIVMVGILSTSLATTKLVSKNNSKIELSQYTDSIISQLKSKDVGEIITLSEKYYFVYFNDDMMDINTWIKSPNGGTAYNSSCLSYYPINTAKKYGALIVIKKEIINSIDSYHIYVRAWTLKTKDQSVSDYYISR